jgi:hypothetical protein
VNSIRHAPDDSIFPSVSDGDLWASVWTTMRAAYPERALAEHVRQAFESVCAEQDEALRFGDFMRKVRLTWLWKRPPLPRGMTGMEDGPHSGGG